MQASGFVVCFVNFVHLGVRPLLEGCLITSCERHAGLGSSQQTQLHTTVPFRCFSKTEVLTHSKRIQPECFLLVTSHFSRHAETQCGQVISDSNFFKCTRGAPGLQSAVRRRLVDQTPQDQQLFRPSKFSNSPSSKNSRASSPRRSQHILVQRNAPDRPCA
jgi:hypothetical protein